MQVQLNRLHIKPDYNIWESFYEWLWLPKMEDFPDLKDNMKSIVKELIKKWIATKNDDNSVWVVFDEELKIPSCILQKRDWTHGYLASDLAAIKYRIQNWNPEKIVYFVDSRQQLHLRQAFLIANLAGWIKNTELFHAFNWFISLKDWAMSTRKWRIIKLDKLLDEAELRAKKIILEKRDDINWNELKELSKIIWIWAIKYGYLKKNRETDVVFDWDEFMSFEWNSGPYIQYAYVRSRRILEKSKINFSLFQGEYPKEEGLEKVYFEYSEEIELIKILSNYKSVLENTTKNNSPHILCKYSFELTKTFNSFYNNVHILNEEDENKKIIRLKLIELFWEVLKDSFKMLGIDMPDKM
jgi:arginyl-tRNA synthetase